MSILTLSGLHFSDQDAFGDTPACRKVFVLENSLDAIDELQNSPKAMFDNRIICSF